MGCTNSSFDDETNPGSFHAAQSDIKRQMDANIAAANPITKEQVYSKLDFSKGIQASKQIISRGPIDSFTNVVNFGREFFLEAVDYCLSMTLNDPENVAEMIQMMLDKGADPNTIGQYSSPFKNLAAIHIVATKCLAHPSHAMAILNILVRYSGIDVNIKTKTADSDTAAHIIARHASEALLAILRKSGNCDFNVQNAAGQSVADCLQVGKARAIGEKVESAYHICIKAAKGDSTVDVEKAVSFLRNIDDALLNRAVPESGMTLLGTAAAHGFYNKTFQILVEQGKCDPNLRDSHGKLPDYYLADRPEPYKSQIHSLLSKYREMPPAPPSAHTELKKKNS